MSLPVFVPLLLDRRITANIAKQDVPRITSKTVSDWSACCVVTVTVVLDISVVVTLVEVTATGAAFSISTTPMWSPKPGIFAKTIRCVTFTGVKEN